MSTPPSKALLKDQLVRALTADLAVRERAYRAAREGATHQEAKPENDKDTRALEQSYLARGEALRLEDLRTALAEVQTMPDVLPRRLRATVRSAARRVAGRAS